MDGIPITFHRRRWKLVFERLKHDNGTCDSPDTPGKKIRIDPRVVDNEVLFLDTVLHEALHASNWNLDEEYVADYATKTAELLYKLGFRLMEDPNAKESG